MAFCLAELHLWSTKTSLQVQDTDIGTYQFYDKGKPANPIHHHYYTEKQHFTEARGYSWSPRNRRPEKLRDSLKELEELLQASSCVATRWTSKGSCQLMLSSGVLVTLTLSGPQLDRVCVDHTLVGRLPANTVTDAVLTDRLLLLSFVEQSHVCMVYVNRGDQGTPQASRRPDKLTPSEIKVVCVEVPSSLGLRLARRVCLNRLQDMAVCWWPLDRTGDHVWPWAPPSTHTHSADNIVLLACSASDSLKVLASVQTEGEPLDCGFSLLQAGQLLTVEVGPSQACWAQACVYQCGRTHLQRLSAVRIALPSPAVVCARHPAERTLLLGLCDSSLLLYDQRRGASLLAPCPVPPSLLAWHPAGAMVVVGGGQRELLCFDVGLAPLGVALVAEEASPSPTLRLDKHLHCSGGLERLHWGSGLDAGPEGTDVLMLAHCGGPLAALFFRLGALTGGQMGLADLLQHRLRCGQVGQALGILQAMDWSTMADECYRGLSSMAEHLLRLELTADTEVQLVAVLGVFYAPTLPLSDSVVLDYREPISKYARRFFHLLLRHQCFERAFLLAVDIGARDLFMDLHYVASDKGELVLADVAKKKANEMHPLPVATEEPVQGRNEVCGSTVCDRQVDAPVERQSSTEPTLLDLVTPQMHGGDNRRKPQEETIGGPVTAGTIWPWRHTDTSLVDTDNSNGKYAGTLKFIDLGLV